MFKKEKSTTPGVTAEIRIRRCYACGAVLQDQNPSVTGYISRGKLDSDEELLCERCYKLRHVSGTNKNKGFNVDYIHVLSDAKENSALVVYVLNAFTLAGSLIDGIGKYLPDNVICVINKKDILSGAFDDEEYKHYVMVELSHEGIHPKDIILTSSSDSEDVNRVYQAIEANRHGRSVYFVGVNQVGKTALINNLLKNFSNTSGKPIVTQPYPGTSLDVIMIPVDKDNYIYDIPGIYNPSSYISFVEPSLVKYVVPRNAIRLETYPSKPGQSFVLSNLAKIDFVSGNKTDFSFSKSNDISVERCKINKSESIFDSICSNGNITVKTNKISKLDDLAHEKIVIDQKGNYRIRLVGLVNITFAGSNQVLDVYIPHGIKVNVERIGD